MKFQRKNIMKVLFTCVIRSDVVFTHTHTHTHAYTPKCNYKSFELS